MIRTHRGIRRQEIPIEEILPTDQESARLIAQTDSNDLIIITSDHGESLWEHGEREHGVLHRSVTRVPLIIRPPGIQGACRASPKGLYFEC